MSHEPAQVEGLFLAAAEIAEPQERAAFLDRECRRDPRMRGRIEALLASHEGAGDFLQPRPGGGLGGEAAPLQCEATGERIGNYRLVEQIGEGGFGVVWRAEQEQPVRRQVALKIVKLGMDTREVVARFEQERQALAMMDHPNIAKVLDAGATPTGRPFFVMELVRGVRITEYCDEARLPTGDRLQLFIAVCQAVQHAHQKGIIHRDLKPSNILVTQQDGAAVPKVIDFGVAKATQCQALTDLTLFTQREQMIGTPLYMSPEQAELGGVDIDTRSDIYSLGVLLYELLTGRTPFDPETLMRQGLDEIRRAIREREPLTPSMFISTRPDEQRTRIAQHRQADPAKFARLLRGDLDCIVMKALEKDRARRYGTANGLALDLKRHLASEPVFARPVSQLYRFRRMVRRNKLAFTAGAIVAAAVLAGLGFSTWSFLNEQEQRALAKESEEAARQRRYVSDINLAQQALLAHQFGRGRRLLDAHRPGNAGERDLRGWEWRWLWQQFLSEASATLAQRSGRASSVSLSPDGSRVAVGWSDGRVEVCDLSEKKLPPQILQENGPAGRVAFSPDGKAVVFNSKGGLVKRHDFATNGESVLCRAPAEVHDLAFSHDGALLAVLTRTGGGKNPWPDSTPRVRGGTTMVEGGGAPETALVVNAPDGRILHTIAVPAGSAEFFNNVRISPDHAQLYVTCGAFDEPRLRCVRLADGQTLWEAAAKTGGVSERKMTGFSAMDLAPDGRVLATAAGYDQRTIQLWDAQTGERLRALEAHGDYIADLAFSSDGTTLASASSDETVRLWDTRTWRESAPALCGNGDAVEAVAISPDGRRLATGSKDGLVLLWDPATRPPPGGRHLLPPTTLFSFLLPGGRHAFALKQDGRRSFIDVVEDRETPLILEISKQGYYGGPNFLGYPNTPRGFQLYEVVDAGAQLLAEVPLRRPVGDWFAYSPEARLLAWTEPAKREDRSPNPEAKTIYVTSIDPPHTQVELTFGGEISLPGSFDTTGQFLLAVGPGGDARVWDIARQRRLPAAEAYLSPFGMPVFGNLRNALGTRVIRDWVATAARPAATPRRFARTDPAPPGFWPPGRVTSRAYSPDGRTTALATENGSVMLFDAAKQEKIATLHGRAHAVFALAFSPDGTRLHSANDAIWDVKTGQELVTLPAEGALHSIAQFSDDGNTLLVGSWHSPGEYQYWRAPSWAEIEEVERSGRGWSRREEW